MSTLIMYAIAGAAGALGVLIGELWDRYTIKHDLKGWSLGDYYKSDLGNDDE